jgi:hypothetical protein
MISVICVYNDRTILDNYLLKSINGQTSDRELILVDNTSKSFKSAAEALNKGGRDAKGEYLMFVHQDVRLPSEDWLKVVESRLTLLPNLGIAGVAGARERKRCTVTNLRHGDPPRPAGNIQIDSPEKVQTLDECLILIPKPVFDELQFDEETCDDWHLYAVDYSLSVGELGYDVYVIPDYVYHRSSGDSMSDGYYRVLDKVLEKHRNAYPVIYTTNGDWSTAHPIIVYRLLRLANKLNYYFLRLKRLAKSAVLYAMRRGVA